MFHLVAGVHRSAGHSEIRTVTEIIRAVNHGADLEEIFRCLAVAFHVIRRNVSRIGVLLERVGAVIVDSLLRHPVAVGEDDHFFLVAEDIGSYV